MSGLTEEQRRRIEENRKKALERRKQSPHKITPPQTGMAAPALPIKPSQNGPRMTSHNGPSMTSHNGPSMTSHSGTGLASQSKPLVSNGVPAKMTSMHLNGAKQTSQILKPTTSRDTTSSGGMTSQSAPPTRTPADIEANKRRALEKLRAKKALAEKSNAVTDKIHPERTSPAKSNELVHNYISNVMKTPEKMQNSITSVAPPKMSQNSNLSSVKPAEVRPTAKAAEQQKAAIFYGQKVAKVKAECVLIDRLRFKVVSDYCAPLIEIYKSMKTRSYDAVSKDWTFKLEDHDSLIVKVQKLQGDVTITALPHAIKNVFRNHMKGNYSDKVIPLANLAKITDQDMVSSLMPFQKEGVDCAISRNGRILLADDMGLGKSVQAICISSYYRHDWPLLVVCPSSLRFAWKEHFLRWLPSIREDQITVIVTGKDKLDKLINIISYDLMTKKAKQIAEINFNCIIMDESHLLKSGKTARTRAATPVLKQSRRVILLSGTPALSRPNELYSQIQAVDPRLFTNFQDFGIRYCAGKKNPWGWDFSGASNMTELQLLLEESIMIRRLKSEVIKQLPSKRREMVLLDPEAITKGDKGFKTAEKTLGKGIKGAERHGALLQYFQETSKVKVNAVKDYILDLLETGKKFLVFAHHSIMLDALQSSVENKYEYIRIDGSVPAETRKLLCDRFQRRDDVKVALLSIMAANTGLNLTAASLVVFAELFWNPGVLTQAEDRVHRIGQEDSVLIQYLVATNTADDYIWPLIQSKLDVLGKVGLSKDNFAESNTIVAKTKDHNLQTGILDYFKQHSNDVLTEDGVVSVDEVKNDDVIKAKDDVINPSDENEIDEDIDWGDDDEDSMLEAVDAVEFQSPDKPGTSKTIVVEKTKSSKNSLNARYSESKLWDLAAQPMSSQTEPTTSKVSKAEIESKPKLDIIPKVKELQGGVDMDSSFDWLDSIDDEMSDAILAGGPELKRRKVE